MKSLNPKDYILVKGASTHNLKNIDVAIPKGKIIVFTGLSGSGKSTLAFDTIYAEGQRRYVESLSTYARQFLGKIQKPQFQSIQGLTPAIALQQKKISYNRRSTVGTLTEIYNYIKILFSRVGKTISPVSGAEISKHSVSDVVNFIKELPKGARFQVIVKKPFPKDKPKNEFILSLKDLGYQRVWLDGKNQILQHVPPQIWEHKNEVSVVIDRLVVSADPEFEDRCFDSVDLAFSQGEGRCTVLVFDMGTTELVSERDFSFFLEEGKLHFEEPSPQLFSFNSEYAHCPDCKGYGVVFDISERLVIPDPNLSVSQGAVVPWKGEYSSRYKDSFLEQASKVDFPIDIPYRLLTSDQKKLLWGGSQYFEGIYDYFEFLKFKKSKGSFMQQQRFKERCNCQSCDGSRLRKEASYIKITGVSITEIVNMTLSDLYRFFEGLKLSQHDTQVAQRILFEIKSRLSCLMDLGLSYLTLGRATDTLSGGEVQRISLANCLGNNLKGATYVLDEPSIGLHARDTEGLIKVLRNLRNLGNTVLVVEHDEAIIRAADQLIDMGPKSGHLAGEILYQGPVEKNVKSLTLSYVFGEKKVLLEKKTRIFAQSDFFSISDINFRNLRQVSIKIPVHAITVVTGVSGSGKSTLVSEVIYPSWCKKLGIPYSQSSIDYPIVGLAANEIMYIEFVDQDSIGKTSRSIPVTYIKAYDEIRELFAAQPLAKAQEMTAAHFSYNTPLGRCAVCKGEGEICEEMQFMADIYYTCELCQGSRFNSEVLQVSFEDKNIADILSMTVDESIAFFTEKEQLDIAKKISPLSEVGLGYLRLNQSVSRLSGGEAQRVKLAYFISKGSSLSPTLFIFDEPTVGLHFEDVKVLLEVFHALLKYRHTVLIVEHNLDVIKNADWIIDLGPESGDKGGNVVFQGMLSSLLDEGKSHTARYLS